MEYIKSIILGIVQGLTEFLPVSSTGHLTIFQQFFNLGGSEIPLCDVCLHLGTLVAVFIAFRKTIYNLIIDFFKMLGSIFTGKYSYKNSPPYQKMIVLLIAALIPLFFILPLKDTVESLFKNVKFVGAFLIVTAVILYIGDRAVKGKKTMENATIKDSLTVGIFQAVAVLPGLSRSGSTITGGLLSGFSREFAVEFSFILSIPAILGAAILSIKDVVSDGTVDKLILLPYIAGAVVAAVAGFFAIKLITYLVKKDKFGYFVYYCAAVGVITIIAAFILNK